jgi:hypothetical protein
LLIERFPVRLLRHGHRSEHGCREKQQQKRLIRAAYS